MGSHLGKPTDILKFRSVGVKSLQSSYPLTTDFLFIAQDSLNS